MKKFTFDVLINTNELKKQVKKEYSGWEFPDKEVEKAYHDYTYKTYLKQEVISQLLCNAYEKYGDFHYINLGGKTNAGYYIFTPDFKIDNPLNITLVSRNVDRTINTYKLPIETIVLCNLYMKHKNNLPNMLSVPKTNEGAQKLLIKLKDKHFLSYNVNSEGKFENIKVPVFGDLLTVEESNNNIYTCYTFTLNDHSIKIGELVPITITTFLYDANSNMYLSASSLSLPLEVIEYISKCFDDYEANKEKWAKENEEFVKTKHINGLKKDVEMLNKELNEKKKALKELN